MADKEQGLKVGKLPETLWVILCAAACLFTENRKKKKKQSWESWRILSVYWIVSPNTQGWFTVTKQIFLITVIHQL